MQEYIANRRLEIEWEQNIATFKLKHDLEPVMFDVIKDVEAVLTNLTSARSGHMLCDEIPDGVHCFTSGDAAMYKVESCGAWSNAECIRNSGLRSFGGRFKAIHINNEIFKVFFDGLTVVKFTNVAALT